MGFFTKSVDVKKFYNKEPKVLGSGNFAKVYKATVKVKRHPEGEEQPMEVGKAVAIKEIDKSKVEDMGDIDREIEVMKLVKHKNIIRLYEIFDEAKKMNLVMVRRYCHQPSPSGPAVASRCVAHARYA